MVTPMKCLAANFPLNEPDDFYSIGEGPNRDYKHQIELVSDYVSRPFDFFEAWINLAGETERFFVYFKRVGGSRSVVICYQTEAGNRTDTQAQWDDTKDRHEEKYYKHEKEKKDEEDSKKKHQRSVDASSSKSKKAKFVPNSLTKGPPKPYAKGRGSGNRHFNHDLLEPAINVEDVSAPPSSTILSTVCSGVHDGGKTVSLRDPADNGQDHTCLQMPPPMKLIVAMVQAMGGLNGKEFKDFCLYCDAAYQILRRNANVILNLFALMLDAGIPNIEEERDKAVLKVEQRLQLNLADQEVFNFMIGLILQSNKATMPEIIDIFHDWNQRLSW